MPTSSSFTYTVPGRVQQDTKAYVRYLDIPICGSASGHIYPPGWFECHFLDNSQAIGEDASANPKAGLQPVGDSCLPQFFNCSRCPADKEYYQKLDLKNNFIDFQFRIPGNWQKGFADPSSLSGTYDFEVTIWSCAEGNAKYFIPTPTVNYKLPIHRFGAPVTTFSGTTPSGTAFQNVRINAQSFNTYACENNNIGVPYANNQGFITVDVYPPGGDPYTIYSQMFSFECNPCPAPIIKIKSTYPTLDFWGNIYNTAAIVGIGTNFVFDNTRWWPGELFETAVTSNRKIDDNQNTQSVTADKKFRGRVINGIPQYETENLAINLQGIETFIDDIPYNKGTGFEKNQEIGSLWYPTFTVEQNFGYGIDNPVKNCN